MNDLVVKPIGIYHSHAIHKHQAPRQGTLPGTLKGRILLNPGQDYELALRDLQGFDRIWVIYQFHHNDTWKPLVRPPIAPAESNRIGCFATRSPYRPNPIGISAVRLLNIQGLELEIEECDLLDSTPILDLKPYIPQYDSFPNSHTGWLEQSNAQEHQVEHTEYFQEQQNWLTQHSGPDLLTLAQGQLSTNPMDKKRKRVQATPQGGILAYRTWRIQFKVETDPKPTIHLQKITTGYTAEQLQDPQDPYSDKELHRLFRDQYPQ